jgi:8-oxo-dGTP diphosphatase
MPGGGVEFGESIRDAVAREVFEETGYTVDVGHILAEHHFTVPRTRDRRPFRSQRFLLAATITGGELGTTETDGTTDFARWIPIAEVSELEPRADIVDVALAALSDPAWSHRRPELPRA